MEVECRHPSEGNRNPDGKTLQVPTARSHLHPIQPLVSRYLFRESWSHLTPPQTIRSSGNGILFSLKDTRSFLNSTVPPPSFRRPCSPEGRVIAQRIRLERHWNSVQGHPQKHPGETLVLRPGIYCDFPHVYFFEPRTKKSMTHVTFRYLRKVT